MTHTPDVVRVFAPAKINLFLHVGEKRVDGFHDLESLVVFAYEGDKLAFERRDASEPFGLLIDGSFMKALIPDPASVALSEDNLVMRAAQALATRSGGAFSALIHLTKNLPVASGIGGGSADAAATLLGLTKLWKLQIADADLHAIAEKLGSDVPVCLQSQPCWMEGRGERVTVLQGLPEIPAVLVNPGVAVPTAKIFSALKTRSGLGHAKPARGVSVQDLVAYLQNTRNDLETPARTIAPIIGEVLAALRSESLLARMSGSGATCFGLYQNDTAAMSAAQAIGAAHRDWWVEATRLGGSTLML